MTDASTQQPSETGHHQRNGHTLELDGCMWRCLQCGHVFDADCAQLCTRVEKP